MHHHFQIKAVAWYLLCYTNSSGWKILSQSMMGPLDLKSQDMLHRLRVLSNAVFWTLYPKNVMFVGLQCFRHLIELSPIDTTAVIFLL